LYAIQFGGGTVVKKTASVVIIGGGIIGASTLYYLSQKGHSDIVLLEKGTLGCGTTAYTAGWVRFQQDSDLGIQMAQISLNEIKRFQQEENIGLKIKGSITTFMADKVDQELENTRLLESLDIPVTMMTKEDIKEVAPILNTSDLSMGRYCKEDGVVDANALLLHYVRKGKAFSKNIIVEEGVQVNNIRTDKGKVIAVETSEGIISTPVVINAAGIYADHVGKSVGLDIPLIKKLGHNIYTEPIDSISDNMPLLEVLDVETLYIGSSGKRADYTIGSFKTDGYDHRPRLDTLLEKYHDILLYRAPALAQSGIVNCTAGVRAHTHDGLPIIGFVNNLEGYFNNCCYGSEGIIYSPIGGILLAELIAEGKTQTLSLEPFLLERFNLDETIRD
jgi:sarcosine oxidase subunit beta